jgi:hypothetical protein
LVCEEEAAGKKVAARARITLDKSHSLVYAISPRNFVVVGMGWA